MYVASTRTKRQGMEGGWGAEYAVVQRLAP